MQLQKILSKNVIDAFDKLFSVEVENIEFQPTKKEFEGDITIVIFPFVKILKQNPKDIAEKLGNYLENQDCVVKYNVVSGFLNLVISDDYYIDFFESIKSSISGRTNLDFISQLMHALVGGPNQGTTNPNIPIPMGAFTQDYEYVDGIGDLDQCNGRFGVTPEFPNGIYYYVVTDDFPFFTRCLKGDI